jgi:hypothetical protein
MINSASKCPKITLKIIKFSKPKFRQKFKLRGISPLESFEGGLITPPPLVETLPTLITKVSIELIVCLFVIIQPHLWKFSVPFLNKRPKGLALS